MKTKMVTAILVTLFLASMLSMALNSSPVMAIELVPIVDGDVIPFGSPPELPITLGGEGAWDKDQIGLVVERGDGFVDIGLPDGISQLTDAWGIHGYITFNDAEVTSVKDWKNDGTLATMDYHVAYGLENGDDGIADIGTAANPITNKDEVNWGTSWVEFWLAAWGGRDCFRIELNYLSVAASMKIDYSDGYRVDTTNYGLGPASLDDTGEYDAWIPLIKVEFGAKSKLGSYHWSDDISTGSAGVKYWYEDTNDDLIANYLYLEFHVTYFGKEDHSPGWLGYFIVDPGFTSDGYYDSMEEGNYKVMNVWGKIFLKGPWTGDTYFDTGVNEASSGFMWHGNCWGDADRAGQAFVFADINGAHHVQPRMKLLFTAIIRVPASFRTSIGFHLRTGYPTTTLGIVLGSI